MANPYKNLTLWFTLILVMMYLLKNCACYEQTEGNIFSAIAHMEPLVEIERRLVKLSREYLDQEKEKLRGLKQFAQSVDEAMKLSKDEPIKYLGNPINSYLLIKRFTSGWRDLGDRLTIDESKMHDVQVLLNANRAYLPTFDKDVVGATSAMFRLQDTYGITARELADGVVKGVSKSTHYLTARDCWEIAELAHRARRYVRMKEWLDESERLMFDPEMMHRRGNLTNHELFEYLSWAHYLSNNLTEALKYTELILRDDPTNENAKKNQEFYKFCEKENVEKWLTKEQWDFKEARKNFILYEEGNYVTTCKGRTKPLKIKNMANLVCFYKQDVPRLILKPAKMTRVHDNPEVLLFHDLITDEEMRKLKELATPRLATAKVIDPRNERHITASYRVSKNMFLQPFYPADAKISRILDRRFADWTGLDLESSESLQMNNYGLGGQYEFHHDHGEPNSSLDQHPYGNRIATILCYLSDVERGGNTVFTKLGLSLHPKKGDGVFWYNLYRNGTGIWDTEHASCPVVAGSKWVANKWIHTHGNEFIRKCSTNRLV